MGSEMFFDGWAAIWRVVAVGVPAYALLIIVLRLTGKRTLSKMNAFDFVVTVAFGSTLAATLLDDRVSLAEGTTALTLLVLLQFAVAWSAARWDVIDRLVKAEAAMVFHDGQFLTRAMRRERVTREEILSAVRQSGLAGLDGVRAVVLETSGDLSVVRRTEGDHAGRTADDEPVLASVRGSPSSSR